MRLRKYLTYSWKHSTSYFASLSLLYQFKCGKKFMLQNIPFSCLNAIDYIYSLAAGINVFTERRNGRLRQSFLLFPLWQTAVFGRFTSPGIDQTAVQWDQIAIEFWFWKFYALSEDISKLFVLLSIKKIHFFGNTNVKATSKRLMCHFLAM